VPIYEYYNSQTDVTIEVHRSVADRNRPVEMDGLFFVRATTVPSRISIHGVEPSADEQFDQNILKSYYKKEQSEGSRFRSGYSKKQLAKTWKT
jgi:hypothetical protein